MTRNRVRRPFAVEVKQRSRSTSASPEQRNPSALWNLTDLAQEPARPSAPPKRPAPVAFALPEPARAEARRVLPSLIAPPVVSEPDEPIASAREPRLPRVRRGADKAQRPEAAKVRAETARSVPIAVPGRQAEIQARIPAQALARTEASAVAPRPARARTPRTPDTLRIGERWKRRLPRVCW